MPEITVTIKFRTGSPEELNRAIHGYLQETLENEFIQGTEEIVSIKTDFDDEPLED